MGQKIAQLVKISIFIVENMALNRFGLFELELNFNFHDDDVMHDLSENHKTLDDIGKRHRCFQENYVTASPVCHHAAIYMLKEVVSIISQKVSLILSGSAT